MHAQGRFPDFFLIFLRRSLFGCAIVSACRFENSLSPAPFTGKLPRASASRMSRFAWSLPGRADGRAPPSRLQADRGLRRAAPRPSGTSCLRLRPGRNGAFKCRPRDGWIGRNGSGGLKWWQQHQVSGSFGTGRVPEPRLPPSLGDDAQALRRLACGSRPWDARRGDVPRPGEILRREMQCGGGIRGSIITMDALHTVRDTAVPVLQHGDGSNLARATPSGP